MNEEIKQLEEEFKNGLYDDDPLIDLVLHYKKEMELLEKENKKLHNKIENAIEYIEDTLDLKEEYNDEVECVVIDILEILKGSDVDEM